MSKLLDTIHELNNLVVHGKAMEAFEKYYDDHVIMQENEAPPTYGKDANRKREQEFYENIIEFRSAEALKVTSGKNITIVEWKYDYTHKEWGIRDYRQVSIQEWENGKIIKEKFYYNS